MTKLQWRVIVLAVLVGGPGLVLGRGPRPAADTVRLRLRIPAGLRTETTVSGFLRLAVDNRVTAFNFPESSIPDQHQSSWKRTYQDTYAAVRDGIPARIVRHTVSDTKTAKNPLTGKMETEDNPTKDTTVTLTVQPGGTIAVSEETDPQAAEILRAGRVGSFVTDRTVRAGEEWALSEEEIKACLALVESGSGRLKLVRVETDPAWRQPVADLEGPLSLTYTIPIQEGLSLPLKFEGTLKLRILAESGLEILRKIDGTAGYEFRGRQGAGSLHSIGKGEYHEVVVTRIVPAEKPARDEAGAPPREP